jgi:hypothetical protein
VVASGEQIAGATERGRPYAMALSLDR